MTTEHIPLAVSREEFLANLTASGLLDAPGTGTTVVLPAAPDGHAAAQSFVAAGRLTQFQAEAVLSGRLADLRIGNYDILNRLGAGAMGTVFKARHRRMKRTVALKVLNVKGEQSKTFVARFQREVEIIAQMIHPNIVLAFDADEAEAGLFLVMEFIDGRDLASEVASRGPLPIADAVDYVVQSAHGLEYAHKHGLIHRDIKPANILRAVTGEIKVADLGLARINDEANSGAESLTQAGGVLGTIDYMPPEQAVDSTTIDARADQYSLGCTLYFLLTGQPVYKGSSAMGVLLKHRDAPIPTLSAVRPDAPAELDAIFRKMVAKKPDERFPSMTEVIRALEAVPVVRGAPAVAVRTGEPSLACSSSQNINFDATLTYPPSRPESEPGPSVVAVAVVLVEASRTQAGIIRKYLEQLGITEIRIASSGAQAVEMARSSRTHVLMSSMHLSDMTGVELARVVRNDANLSEVGFLLTTSESDHDQAAALQGVVRTVLMPKPFDLPRLARAVAEAAGIERA